MNDKCFDAVYCTRNQRKIAVYNLVECFSFCSYEAIVDAIIFA